MEYNTAQIPLELRMPPPYSTALILLELRMPSPLTDLPLVNTSPAPVTASTAVDPSLPTTALPLVDEASGPIPGTISTVLPLVNAPNPLTVLPASVTPAPVTESTAVDPSFPTTALPLVDPSPGSIPVTNSTAFLCKILLKRLGKDNQSIVKLIFGFLKLKMPLIRYDGTVVQRLRYGKACAPCRRFKVKCVRKNGEKVCVRCNKDNISHLCQEHNMFKKPIIMDSNSSTFSKKRLSDADNAHQGLPCRKNKACSRPFKHTGYCKLKQKKTSKRRRRMK